MARFPHIRRFYPLRGVRLPLRAAHLPAAGLLLALALAISSVSDAALAADQVTRDTFNGSAPGTALPSHTPETDTVGGGWQQSIGAGFRITPDGLAVSDAGLSSGPHIAVIDTLLSEYNLTVTGTRDVKSSMVGVVVRYVDELNYIGVRHNGTLAELFKVVNGVEQVLSSGPFNTQGPQTATAMVSVRASGITAFIEGVGSLSTSDTAFHGATKAGLLFTSIASTSFRDFTVDALSPSPGPAPEAEPLPAVIADSFTAPDGTLITEHTPSEVNAGSPWQAVRGQWVISGGRTWLLQPSVAAPFADQLAAVQTSSILGPDISADITWHGGTAGLAWNVQDTANYSIVFWDGSFLVAGQVEGGLFRERGRQSVEWAQGQTRNLRVRVNGTNARVYLDNGAPVMLATGLSGEVASNVGIFVRMGQSNTFDNFTARPALPLSQPDPALVTPPPFPGASTSVPSGAWVFDSFDSGDFTPLQHRTPDVDPSGAGWSIVSGTWQIWEAKASEQSGVFDHAAQDRFAVIDTGTDEYELSVEAEWDGGRVGVLFGGVASGPSDAGRNGFLFWRDGDRLKLGKLIGGVYFELDSAPVTWPAGARRTFEVRVEGTSAELSLSGQAVFEFSDPDLAFATWAGLFQRGRNDERFDDFTITLPEGIAPPDLNAPLGIAEINDLVAGTGTSTIVPVTITGYPETEPVVSATALPRPGGVAVADSFTGTGPETAPHGAMWRLVRPGAVPVHNSGVLDLPAGGDGGDQRLVINTGYSDVTVSAVASAASGRFGLVARHDGSPDDLDWLMGWVDIDNGLLLIGRSIGGQFRLLGFTPVDWVAGEARLLSLTVRGSEIELAVDGEVRLAAEEPGLLTGSYAGLFTGHTPGQAQFTEFEVEAHGLPGFMSLEPTIGGNYQLVIAPLAGHYGEYDVTVSATADGESGSESFVLTVPQPGAPPVEGQEVPLESLFLRGDAAIDGGVLMLTPDEVWKGGAAWIETPQQVAGGFSATFTFEIARGEGPAANTGADGLAFVLQRSPAGVEAIGLPGAGLGYELIGNSLAIEFDTWANEGEDGLHVAIHSGGTGPNGPGVERRIAFAEIISLAPNTTHTARIIYESGTLRVFLDDLITPVLEANLDLAVLLDLPDGEAFAGLTAGTGAASQSHNVRSLHFQASE